MSTVKAIGLPNKIKALGLGDSKLNKIEEGFGNLPTITFKEEPDIEVGKKSLIQFLISGNSRWGKNDISIDIINDNKELTFTTLKWTSVDYGFTMRTNITSKKSGKFTINFKVNNKYTNSLTLEAKYKVLENPKLVNDTKINYSEEQKAQMISTVYGESSRDENLCVNIPWIYYNLTKKYGFEKGLRRSSYYKDRNDNKWISEAYRVCMYYLGQGAQYADSKMVNGTKIKDYCKETNKSFRDVYKYYIDIIRNYFNHNIFNAQVIKNPFYNWEGQGYWRDMNIRMNNSDKDKWAKASQYFHLQKKGYVNQRFVKEIIAYDPVRGVDSTTYLCDDLSITKYFKDNPTRMPKFEDGKCVSAGNKLLCSKDEKNAIPGVHFEK
ncbi:hypothetical protein QE422_000564 [Chryseobacterium sp. SORGH_AS 447]|uniref:hypothetical protein n=1 Tax=Chryseobacterium sp. SORGH_AS_0447 TaxID=3041769 RepID=UPI0027878DDD|nr:hypothetical protein [Chryseobacterium sp. SORGH_AS_0447]MDQ1160196.1 hypothetical protein [Chryseobacterium sp. SORGH_AS_0447]